jgi:bifunctional oligoribonuclease and PAP phosphatase NrnA
MTTTAALNWDEATRVIQAAQSILIVTHITPDGDAIGSLLGLGNALRALGKSADCAVDDGVPGYLKFLPGSSTIRKELPGGTWDVMISVDASDEERTGKVGVYGREHSETVINLDHHSSNTLFGDVFLIDPEAVAATQIIYQWLVRMEFAFTREFATPLLTGLVTDTRSFRTSNVTSDTLYIAQQLMEHGASLTEVTARTLDNTSFQTISLWRHALATVTLHEHGIITAEITREVLKEIGANDKANDSDLIGFLIDVNEAMIAAVFKETPEGKIDLSLRSKPGFDVAEVAFSLGGGGHKQASGATIDGPLDAAKARAIPLLQAAAQEGKLMIV